VNTGFGRPFDRLVSAALGLPIIGRVLETLAPVDYTIRPVDPARDLEIVAACGATLGANSPRQILEDLRLEFSAHGSDGWLFLIALDDREDRVLGFSRAMRQGRKQDWWVAGLGVRPVSRRRGIGEALMRALLTRLRGYGVSEVRLEVGREARPAIALYRKLGFQAEERPNGDAAESGLMRMVLQVRSVAKS
jgi:ribosomal-protein-alanine N-acetyltransferase